MRQLHVDLGQSRPLFVEQAAEFLSACQGLTELELLDPSLCRGWSRLDLLTHVRLGLDELVGGVSARTDATPDHDAASYWTAHPDDRDADPVPHILWLRRTAAAYHRPSAAVRHLAGAVARASDAVRATPDGVVRFQGQTLSTGDLVATWVVEVAIHLLDLDGGGVPVGASLARRTLEAVADADLPTDLSDVEAVLIGIGRSPWPAGLAHSSAFPVSL